jgi:regulator of sigma E protease
MALFLLILGIVLFIGLVVVHEFGHFVVARRNGVKVEEFGIGFPPRVWSRHMKGGYRFSINLLPLGGFVRLKGEHDADKQPGSFGAASLWAKVKIMAAGVIMNLITAFALLTLLALLGIPKLIDNQFTVKKDTKIVRQQVLIGYIEPDSPAAKSGLKVQDRLVGIEAANQTKTITSAESLPDITKQFAGQEVRVDLMRRGKEESVTLRLRTKQEVEASKKTSNPKGYMGISPTEYTIQRSTWSAPIVAGGLIKQFTEITYKGIGSALANLFRGNTSAASQQVAGPVGIFVLIKDGSLLGYQFILMIIAIISLTLAIMNVLPIPALDGGKLFVTLIFRLMRRPLYQRTEEWIHGTGFALLMVLFVLITIVDVRRFF